MRTALAAWLALVPVGVAGAGEPPRPRPLVCYERLYGLSSELSDGKWYLRLSPSQRLLYDDGETKDLETQLARPDVQDQFAAAYRTGPLQREPRVDHDPGRVRVTAILQAIYPVGPSSDALATVDWFGSRLRVHRRIAAALGRVRDRIQAAITATPSLRPWLDRPGGGYVHRPIAGTDRLSPHSFGIAIDIDPKRTEYWRWDRAFQASTRKPFVRPVPAAIVDAFEAEGFIWGGRWYHFDTMHFEYRPELLDPQCQPEARPEPRR